MAIHAPITGAPTRAIQLPPVLAFLAGTPWAPRDAVERLIEAAIDALDQIDGDPDMEDDADKCTAGDDDVTNWAPTGLYVASQDDDGTEPSLGSLGDDGALSQIRWAEHGEKDGLVGTHLFDAEDDGADEEALQPGVTANAAANDA